VLRVNRILCNILATALEFATPASASNTPAFLATASASTSCANGAVVKIEFNTESFDTDSCYNTTDYRFTPNVAGKYYLTAHVRNFETADFNDLNTAIHKNGSNIININNSSQHNESHEFSAIVEANGTTDYFEVFHQQNGGNTVNTSGIEFSGFRLIGV
jgi:hypothetical protein